MTTRIALVTGGGSGIGRAVALKLLQEGFTVAISGRRQDRLDEVVAEGGARCHGIVSDMRDPQSVAELFEQIEQRFGRLDLLFNNAGTGAPASPLEDLTLERWNSVIETNLTGVFLCTQAAFKMMKAQHPQGGRIINNGSIASMTPRPHMIAYTASKHAVTGITKSVALEGRKYNIACGQIDIGNTATDMATPMMSGTLQADLTLKTEPTFPVSHVADAVAYMAKLPLDANVLSMTVMASAMPFVGRG
jgi:NAD(P)-dependent dehydrogenase (short-subunit alcohol dehydrogenase family)